MRALRLAIVAYAVTACLVGPRYRVPPAPVPRATQYKEAGAWKRASPGDAIPRGAWWTMFHEPELDALQARLAISNQSIAIAVENYTAARAQVRAARAQYFPVVTAAPSASWGRSSGVPGATTLVSSTPTAGISSSVARPPGRFDSYIAALDASWAPDLFGRVRYTVRQRRYAAQVTAADLESTRLAAHGILAQTYFQLRGNDALQEVLDATVVANAQIAALTRARFERGLENESVVVQAERTLEASRVQATAAITQRAQFEHAIATLLGIAATDFSLPRRAHLVAPPAIPTGAPSLLLERRPDIAAAERRMASANAAVGLGYAAYFPLITLSGTAGFASSAVESLFTWPKRIWAVGTGLSETLFDGGARRANLDLAWANYRATVAAYRQTVLTAFQQVEDLLAELRVLAAELDQQRRLVALAQHAFDLERARYEAGLDPYTDLMLQQTALLSARQGLVTLQVQQITGAVALVQALGGGWDRSELPPP